MTETITTNENPHMQTSLKDQINAVREAMEVARRDGVTELYESLNDAASSLAYLNLTKDLEPKEEKIKRLIQRKIDELVVAINASERPSILDFESQKIFEIHLEGYEARLAKATTQLITLSNLFDEIETL